MTISSSAAAAAAAAAAREAARRAAEEAARKRAQEAAKKAAQEAAQKAAEKQAQAAAQKKAQQQAQVKALARKSGDAPTASSIRQIVGRDEMSRGRGAALRAQSATRLGATPVNNNTGPDLSLKTAFDKNAKITADTLSASVSGGFSSEVKNSKGYGVSFGIDAEASVVTDQTTEDGVTTFNVAGEASVTVSGGVNTPKAGLAIAHSEGIKANYSVSMPEEAAEKVDPRTVNPFDPKSMPTGTVVKLDGSQFSSNEFKATFQHLGIESKITESEGVSIAVEKTADNKVRVTAGPTEAIEAYNGVGLDFGVVSASLGNNTSLSGATLKTAEFDLATPEGQAGYNDFLANGTIPSQNGKGVANVATIEKIDFSSQSGGELKVGPIDLSFHGAANTGARVDVTYPDGSMESTVNLDYGGNVPLQLTRKFDPNGQELISERRYAYTFNTDENSAALMNAALTGNIEELDGGSGPVPADASVTLTFTEAQMTAYMKQTQAASDAGFGTTDLDVLVKDYDDQFVNSPEEFAISLARNLGGTDYEQAERMFRISDMADGEVANGSYAIIDATVTVNS